MNQLNNENNINFGRIFRLLLIQSKLVISIVIAMTSITIWYYIQQPKQYSINSLLQVMSSKPDSLSSEIPVDLMLGASSNFDLNSLSSLYQSRSNIISLIETLNLNVSFSDVTNKDSINVLRFTGSRERLTDEIFFIKFQNNNYDLYDENSDFIATHEYNYEYYINGFHVNFLKPLNNQDLDTLIKIEYENSDKLYRKLRSAIDVSLASNRGSAIYKADGLIETSYATYDINYGKQLINTANNIFISSIVESEKEKARRAINFIDQRISELEVILKNNKEALKEFKEENSSLDVNLEVSSIIVNLSEIDSLIGELDLKIEEAKNSYTANNPIYLNLNNQKGVLLQQKNEIEKKIKELPYAQQQYVDLYSDVEITQNIYTGLLNRKISYQILEASTIGNIRVIDNAYMDTIIGPKSSLVYMGFIVSLIFALLIALIRGLFFIPISNPAELSDEGIDIRILGVTPNINTDQEFLTEVTEKQDQKFFQSIESLVLNIKLSLESYDSNIAKKVVLTSPTPNNGKSFLSSHIATKLANVGHKTILIDNDLKRGDLHKNFKTETITLDEFNDINESNIDKYLISKDLYLIPKIKGLDSSFQYLFSEVYNQKVRFFEDFFDFIVIDTAPILSISDTSLLLADANMKLLVVRHGITRINEIRQAEELSRQSGLNYDGIIYNSYEKPSGYYGYYGLYANYNYQYYANKYLYENYEYEDK